MIAESSPTLTRIELSVAHSKSWTSFSWPSNLFLAFQCSKFTSVLPNTFPMPTVPLVSSSQITITLSSLPDAKYFPFPENLTHKTTPACDDIVQRDFGVLSSSANEGSNIACVDQIRTLLSRIMRNNWNLGSTYSTSRQPRAIGMNVNRINWKINMLIARMNQPSRFTNTQYLTFSPVFSHGWTLSFRFTREEVAMTTKQNLLWIKV
jgi:hypothetical protein